MQRCYYAGLRWRRQRSCVCCSPPAAAHPRTVLCTRRWHTDPSGTYIKYKAKAIGSGSEGAQNMLEEGFNDVRGIKRPLIAPHR